MENAVQTAPVLLRGGQDMAVERGRLSRVGSRRVAAKKHGAASWVCWLVLAPERRIEIYRKPEAGAYLERVVHESGDILTSPVLSGLQLSVNDLFARR